MSLVEVEITGLAITARYGTLTAGTILRTDPDYAEHLVKAAGCAKYPAAEAVAPADPAAVAEVVVVVPAAKPARAAKVKAEAIHEAAPAAEVSADAAAEVVAAVEQGAATADQDQPAAQAV